jgi:hypothetical protein
MSQSYDWESSFHAEILSWVSIAKFMQSSVEAAVAMQSESMLQFEELLCEKLEDALDQWMQVYGEELEFKGFICFQEKVTEFTPSVVEIIISQSGVDGICAVTPARIWREAEVFHDFIAREIIIWLTGVWSSRLQADSLIE